jgi:hypothetical protein
VTLRFSYGTSGFTRPRLPDALADIGHFGPVFVGIQGGVFDTSKTVLRSLDFLCSPASRSLPDRRAARQVSPAGRRDVAARLARGPPSAEECSMLEHRYITPEARAWLDEATAHIAADARAIHTAFPAARRRCGRAAADNVRAELLLALPLRGEPLAAEVTALYQNGDTAEQRAVLRALPLLDIGDLGLALVCEALRGNDTTLIEAAVGPYAARHLDPDAFRHAVLKCVFCGIPLDRVSSLAARADRELARMLTDFAHERVAAGREVPADIWPVVAGFPELLRESGLIDEIRSAVPERRAAAARAIEAFEAFQNAAGAR